MRENPGKKKRMKRTFSEILALFLITLVLAVIFFLIAAPKSIIFDQILMKKGVYLLAEYVDEGIRRVKLSDVRIIISGKEVARVERIIADLTLGGVILKGKCGDAVLTVKRGWGGDLSIKGRDFGCLKDVEKVSSDLNVAEGIRGRVTFVGIDTGVVTVDRVELTFRGKEFDGKVTYGKFEFTGKGTIRLNKKDIFSSTIKAEFTGPVGRVSISGTLKNPSVKMPVGNLY